jgi:hypothetical protein
VEGHLTITAHINIDAATFAFLCAFIFPCAEMLGWRHDHDIAPSGVEIGLSARFDCGVLRRPKRIRVGEIATLAEQIGDDLISIAVEVEQRLARPN